MTSGPDLNEVSANRFFRRQPNLVLRYRSLPVNLPVCRPPPDICTISLAQFVPPRCLGICSRNVQSGSGYLSTLVPNKAVPSLSLRFRLHSTLPPQPDDATIPQLRCDKALPSRVPARHSCIFTVQIIIGLRVRTESQRW